MSRPQWLPIMGLLVALGGLALQPATAPASPAGAQDPLSSGGQHAPVVIKTETNVVLVDVIATDKKGSYLKDLEQKDFHVYEDHAEQTLSSFSREADLQPDAPTRPRYLVLFFDDSTMDARLQVGAREEAEKFVESTASANRLVAVVDFGEALKITQNFTGDGSLLKRAVSTVVSVSVRAQPDAERVKLRVAARGAASLDRMDSDYGPRGPLVSIREVAESLLGVPERKTLILFSAGFALTPDHQSELTATLNALNRANIAVYPVDVRGFLNSGGFHPNCSPPSHWKDPPDPNCINQDIVPNREITPNDGDNLSGNEQVLYTLAKGTGGFEIFNNNDLLHGLEKVSKEMGEYYNLGYAPQNPVHDGSFHKISVKVTRPGVVVRYRTGYYDVKSPDLLKGRPEGKVLEERVAGSQAGEIPLSISAPYFYVEPGVARVNLALSIPGSAVEFEKQNGVLHSEVNVLGIAYRENGSVAARFSDTVKLDCEKKDIRDFAGRPFDYQNTFNIAPGSYTLKVVLSAGGERFGKYTASLAVDDFSGNDLSLGGPALGNQFLRISQLTASMHTQLQQQRAPLLFEGMELVPSTSYRFARSTQPVVYVEVYDPALKGPLPPRVGVVFNIIDKKTNQPVFSSHTILINDYSQPGNPLIPVGFQLPVDQLQGGAYRLEIKGRDALGNVSTVRGADFSVE